MLFIATFQPPDFTADMYDTIQEDDLDFEDMEWQKWLQGLINSGTLQYLTNTKASSMLYYDKKHAGSARA